MSILTSLSLMVKAHVQFVIYVTPSRLLFKSPRFSVTESRAFLFKGRREAGKEGARSVLLGYGRHM